MALALIYPPPANVTDYTTFLRQVCGFDATVLPDNSPWIPYSLQFSLDTVNCVLVGVAPNEAVLAQYNLAADILINYVPDQVLALTSLTWADGVVTAIAATQLPSNLGNGDEFDTVIASAVPAGYNGSIEGTVTNGVTFTYELAADPGTETSPGTFISTYFASLREDWNINVPSTGVVVETHDENTGSTYQVPEQFKELTLGDLQNLKTPYGRAYMAFAQKYGQTLWGST